MRGLRVARTALGSINKRVYAAEVGVDATRLEPDRDFKEEHRLAMVEHHRLRNKEDPEWCLKEVWQQAEAAQADILLVTDFRTRADHRFFSQRCSARKLVLFRVEACDTARRQRGWLPDAAKDTLYTETDLDGFVGW